MTSSTTGRPEPVLDAARIAAAVSGAITGIGFVLVLIGWATSDQVKSWAVGAGAAVTGIGGLVSVAMPIITAYGARAQVTPLAAPVSVEGAPLTAAAPSPAPAPVTVAGAEVHALPEPPHPPQYPTPWPRTSPISSLGAWTPATPAASAAEPLPIEAEAAVATGRASQISTPTP